ncbi:hypothetical protein CEXT_636431 [Caerostris extrusa]|uniref:Uncharacterized protein n=1 Tax=Caerostris extrusa TaxID=172846 RepID=A0AAV4R9S0_CAEEX|nr:hypothetical protein CEXT_636431 [Caerostris extrusa]
METNPTFLRLNFLSCCFLSICSPFVTIKTNPHVSSDDNKALELSWFFEPFNKSVCRKEKHVTNKKKKHLNEASSIIPASFNQNRHDLIKPCLSQSSLFSKLLS